MKSVKLHQAEQKSHMTIIHRFLINGFIYSFFGGPSMEFSLQLHTLLFKR